MLGRRRECRYNTFGHMFRVTTFGESHGIAIGCVVDGCPPLMPLTSEDIQRDLDRRRPGQSRFTTQRQEPDAVKILSGVMAHPETGAQVTTGTPIALLIENTDQRSKDYSDIKDKFRPGHADFTYEAKYGLRDYRGGGRSSARETATRVAAGAIARKILPDVKVRGALVQMGPHKIDRDNWDWDEIARNPFFCPDKDKAAFFESYLDGIRKSGSSIGAVIEVVAEGVPAGLGRADLCQARCRTGCGADEHQCRKRRRDRRRFRRGRIIGRGKRRRDADGQQGRRFLSNHAGGILGGISTGQPVVARFAVKPTSSILSPRRTVDRSGADTEIVTKGRHDPCVGIRAVPVGEAMMACVLADHFLRHRGQVGRVADVSIRNTVMGPLPWSRRAQMNSAVLQKIIDWLIDGARSCASPTDMMAELCERLVQAGIAALARRRVRADAASRYFRPQFHLAAGGGGRDRHAAISIFRIRRNSRTARSPSCYATGQEVRCRLDDPDSKRFPFFDDMRAEGVTDYIALPLRFHRRLHSRIELDHQAAGRLQRWPAGGAAHADPRRWRGSSRSSACAAPPRSCSTPMSAIAPASAFSGAKSAAATPTPCMRRSGCPICAALPRCPTGCRPRPWSIFSTIISIARWRRSAAHGGEVLKFMGDGLLAVFPIAE